MQKTYAGRARAKNIKIIGFAQGETSTGVLTGVDAYRKVADELGALLIVDTVASLAAVPLDVDKQRIDICFSGSQKAISAPPGMSPITVSPRCRRSVSQAQDESTKLVFRSDNRYELLGQKTGCIITRHQFH